MPNEDQKPKPEQKELPQQEPNQAVSIMEKLEREKLANQKHSVATDESKWIYVQQCRRGHIAFFYTANPLGRVIGPDGWYSKDKRADEPWRGYVPCQECSTRDHEGYLQHEEPVQVNYQPNHKRQTMFIPDPRWVYRIGKTEELRKKYPPHRAEQLNITAANVGVQNPDFPEKVRTISRRTLVETQVEVK